MATESKYLNRIGINDVVESRPERPHDYHCTCEYCSGKFLGEIFSTTHGKYYSNKARKAYYTEQAGDHLDVGQFIGYRWAIQNLTNPGDIVLDPTVGTGTAIVEAINNGRLGVGIELEYPEVTVRNIKAQGENAEGALFMQGDAKELDKYLYAMGLRHGEVDLIINGPPYPMNGSLSSDAPQRDTMGQKDGKTFNYLHPDNMGLAPEGGQWEELIYQMYSQAAKFLKPGGYFVTLIKDMVRNKKPYLLHQKVNDIVMMNIPGFEYYGYFLHKHVPTTMFINTYSKRFPGVVIPLYQTGIVLRKIE